MTLNFPVLLIGFIFFAVGLFLLVNQLKSMKNNTASVKAEVVNYFIEESHSADPDGGGDTTVYFPIMRYCVDGKWYEQKSDVGRGKEKYAIGEEVEIRYDPRHPKKFIIAGDNSTFIISAIGIIIGIGVMIFSFFAQ